MKQQWLLLLATVGMSMGVMAGCENCYGYYKDGDRQSTTTEANACGPSKLMIACLETNSTNTTALEQCKYTYVNYDLCWSDPDCVECMFSYSPR